MNIYQIAAQILRENNLRLNEAFNGAYKGLPSYIKQALAQTNFAKTFSKRGVDQNSKPVFVKLNNVSEFRSQLNLLQKEHGRIAAFAIEIFGAKRCEIYSIKNDGPPKEFVPGSNNPIFIFAIKNDDGQATLATRYSINKHSQHISNVTIPADPNESYDYTTINKVGPYWKKYPYDLLESILSKANGANLYAFVAAEESIAQQRAAKRK